MTGSPATLPTQSPSLKLFLQHTIQWPLLVVGGRSRKLEKTTRNLGFIFRTKSIIYMILKISDLLLKLLKIYILAVNLYILFSN